MASFETAFAKTIIAEGTTLVKDTNGYYAKYGINQQYNPTIDVPNLTLDKAKAIYKSKYWITFLDKLNNQDLANQIFDWRVTSGANAIKGLQTVLNSFGKKLKVDGGFGEGTYNALISLPLNDVLDRYVAVRKSYYYTLHQSDPVKWGTNVYNSWIKRTNSSYSGSYYPTENFTNSYSSALRATQTAGPNVLRINKGAFGNSINFSIVSPIILIAFGFAGYKLYQMLQRNHKGPAYA